MAGSRRWLRAIRGQGCAVCGEVVSEYAIRGLTFKLVPSEEGRGYAAIEPMATVHCPTCGNVWTCNMLKVEGGSDAIKPADMKSGVGWLIDRTRRIINPFTQEPSLPSETLDPFPGSHPGDDGEDEGGVCDCEFDQDPDDDEAGDEDDEPEPATPKPSSAKGKHRGRLLTQPSIRSCCPPSPITTGSLKAAKRSLRCYSDIRTAPSFHRFMMGFGVAVHCETGDPVDEEPNDE